MTTIKNFTIGFIFLSFGVFAQPDIKYFNGEFKKAQEFFKDVDKVRNYDLNEKVKHALPIYLNLLNSDPNNANLNYRIGYCYLNSSKEQHMAIPYLQKAILSTSGKYNSHSSKERNAPLVAYKCLGDALHLVYKFDEAIDAYNTYISKDNQNKRMIAEANRKIEMCKTAKELIADSVHVKIENMGELVNSPYPDYSPLFTADESTMIFTSCRPDGTGDRMDDEGYYFEDIYISYKKDGAWSQAVNISEPINTDDHEASVFISVDGQQILIYKDDLGDGNIYSTKLDGYEWSKPQKLNHNINTKFWETTAFITPDGNTIYFTSNRPGGFGGRDIYKSTRTYYSDWGEPVNLGSTINTPYDEDAPFMHPDGVTLYFSSSGHKTMGGFDVFSSTKIGNDDWTEPKNIGYPINTPNDDIYYVVSPDKKRAYLSSFRNDGKGEKDNYMITFEEPTERNQFVIYKGTVQDFFGGELKNVEILVTDLETGELVGKYHSNTKTGKYLFILNPGKNYSITYSADGHMFHSVNKDMAETKEPITINNDILLPSIAVGSKVVLKNIFFDFDKATLRPQSNIELKKLLDFMNNNPTVSVEISGHTDSEGNDEYNKNLSQIRAQAVVTYLIEHGISTKRMVATGYGETQPNAPNKNADGSDNPEGRQLNRRVELKITGVEITN